MNDSQFNREITRLKFSSDILPETLNLNGVEIPTSIVLDSKQCNNCGENIYISHDYCSNCFEKSEDCPDCLNKGILKNKGIWTCSECGSKFDEDIILNSGEIGIDSIDHNMSIYENSKYYHLKHFEFYEGTGWIGTFISKFSGEKIYKNLNSLIE